MKPVEERFWSKVDRAGDAECWLWNAATTAGYGAMGAGRRGEGLLYAHRVSYEINVGPIPEGLHIDHLCCIRACVNPRHLEPVTQQENNIRAWTARKERV